MSPPDLPQFRVSLRGYHRAQVDELVARARRGELTSEQVQGAVFDMVWRGYDCEEVDNCLEGLGTR
ncbi:MAG: DivIVA domain-containing protein [Micromonosporaceae bacterium]